MKARSELPLDDLRPVLIPSSIFDKGQWVGPYHHFPQLPVSLTWAFMKPRGILYLNDADVAAFAQQGTDWRRAARINSLRVFRDDPLTHAFNGASGEVEAVALMHADALGPSRLVHARQMLKLFPDGFTFFVPERTAAFVMASTASADVVAKIEQIVEEVFAAADVPMSKSGYGHEALIAALTQAGEP